VTFDLDLDLDHILDALHAYPETIVCQFVGNLANCLREEAICTKVYRQTDGRTYGGRRAIALAQSWNELKMCRFNKQ